MKILYFMGGLGNQIFEYAFYLYLQKQYPKESFYGVYNKIKLGEHFGLEINRCFYAKTPRSTWYSNFVAYGIYILRHIFHESRWYDADMRQWSNRNAVMLNAFKYNKLYVPSSNDWLKFRVDEVSLTDQNRDTLECIRSTDSVFMHVRRGDYLSERYKMYFEGICTKDYYKKAVEISKEQFRNPKYFVFSDDIPWCEKNLQLNNCVFIDWNTGEKSSLDMFLMSNCKASIIANSTFSYWGAMLGNCKDFVIYPKKWINEETIPDIFPEKWLGI